ncbi:tyrosine-protein phosphatase [Oceanobacillus salinisoli]|uniref:tyrosine-protein phosphatase n=1 Tax=Oceanobacillus salinisoli TaxID=2678611 RepID=UPI0012E15B6D|nr:CpsB/CapC family capsule biosynthesis tyrosine phosphatase [Oceanobacillus salinisoli]
MIDIHSHILPGIDDGAKTMEDSISMAKAAVDQGIRTIIATPHHRNGKYENYKLDILRQTEELNASLVEHDIPLTVLPGQETRLHGDMIDELNHELSLTLTNNTNYLFVELPSGHVPRYAKQMLFELQLEGYQPIIVHPERNKEIIEHPSLLYQFTEKGVLTQVTAASVIGKFGKNIQKFSHQLIESNQVHFIASDAHNTTTRGFCMVEAYEEIEKQHGMEVRYMFMENTELLIQGDSVNRFEPVPIKKKKFLGLF